MHRAGRWQLHCVAALLSACFTPVPSALGQLALLARCCPIFGLGNNWRGRFRDRVVELAASQGQEAAHLPGANFAEVVHVPEDIRRAEGAQAAARVHGIPDDEIATGHILP